MPRKKIYVHCPHDGRCDDCTLSDCFAYPTEILDFYSREEAETRRRFGRSNIETGERFQSFSASLLPRMKGEPMKEDMTAVVLEMEKAQKRKEQKPQTVRVAVADLLDRERGSLLKYRKELDELEARLRSGDYTKNGADKIKQSIKAKRDELEKGKEKTRESAKQMTENRRKEIDEALKLKAEEITEDARFLSFGGLLNRKDLEQIAERSKGNYTMLTLLNRYAEQNRIDFTANTHNGVATESAELDGIDEATDRYIDRYIDDEERSATVLCDFFGVEIDESA